MDEGNPSAMLKLGIQQNFTKIIFYCTKIFIFPLNCFYSADIYFEGKGVEVDLAKARQLYEKVINYCPNEAMVQKRLGIFY